MALITAENFTTCVLLIIECVGLLCQATKAICLSIFRCFVPGPKKCVHGKVVLITGAAQGLGKLLATKFADLGAQVVLVDLNKDKNDAAAETIKEKGGVAYSYQCDVSQENQVEEMALKVREHLGGVDILVNNAGVLPGKPLFELTSATINKTFQVNTLAHFWTIRQFLPHMIEKGEGHIVAIASIAGMLGCANLIDYCGSKHAIVGMMSALREELYSQGKEESIQLTVICPNTMDTGLVQKPKSRFPSMFPILRVEEAADIVVNSTLRNKKLVVIPSISHTTYKIATLFPVDVLLTIQRFLDYTMDPNES